MSWGRIRSRTISAINRLKISITLPRDLLARVDAEASRRASGNRSAVIEEWLRGAARLRAADRLREVTCAYYDSLAAGDRAEDHALATALGDAARGVRHDD